MIERDGAQILKGALDRLLPIGGQGSELSPGLAKLHLFLGRHAFDHFTFSDAVIALLFRHRVQPVQLIEQSLLRRRRQTVEAGVAAQQALLILHGKALVLVEPAAQMTLARCSRIVISRAGRRCGVGIRGTRIARRLGARPRAIRRVSGRRTLLRRILPLLVLIWTLVLVRALLILLSLILALLFLLLASLRLREACAGLKCGACGLTALAECGGSETEKQDRGGDCHRTHSFRV